MKYSTLLDHFESESLFLDDLFLDIWNIVWILSRCFSHCLCRVLQNIVLIFVFWGFFYAHSKKMWPKTACKIFYAISPVQKPAVAEINIQVLQCTNLCWFSSLSLSHSTANWFSPCVNLDYYLVFYPRQTLSCLQLIYITSEQANNWNLGNKNVLLISVMSYLLLLFCHFHFFLLIVRWTLQMYTTKTSTDRK